MMRSKKSMVWFVLATPIFLCGCFSDTPKVAKPQARYTAIKNLDTARLSVDIVPSTFKGVLQINYDQTYKDSGDVQGIVKGDTLIGDYSYKHYKLKLWKRKPIALLKKGDTLMMGEGIIKNTFGRIYFDQTVPISYSSSSFVFVKQ
ncbi:hypothetical protein [Pedobacter sp. BAL39]|uniref:hypothetical protein n=1 Tax=Pedobacter sp. BAL39 TaxID=391596 RepID=UPI0012F8126E|nr:hypothetical protein [Pedobacter sp. BAL39]